MTSTGTRPTAPMGWALLAAAVGQIVAPIGQSMLEVSQPAEGSEELLITPAGWTFSIWAVIYLLALVHAVVTVRLGTGVDQPRRFQRDLIALYLGASVWIVLSSVGLSWATFLTLAVMTGFALDAARVAGGSAAPTDAPEWTRTLARITSGLYAGWVSAAVFLNLGTAAIEAGIVDPALTSWQVGLLVVALVAALTVDVWLGLSPWYAAAVAWASLGIAAAVNGVSTSALVIAVSGVIGFTGLVVVGLRRGESVEPAGAVEVTERSGGA